MLTPIMVICMNNNAIFDYHIRKMIKLPNGLKGKDIPHALMTFRIQKWENSIFFVFLFFFFSAFKLAV